MTGKIRNHIPLFILFILFSCNPSVEKPETGGDDSALGGKGEFNPQADYTISNIAMNHDYPASVSDTLICAEWNLDEPAIREIIGAVRGISGEELHHLFDHLPCQVVGELEQGGGKFDLAINSGAWLTISSPDSTWRFGNFDTGKDKFFLSSVLTEEEN